MKNCLREGITNEVITPRYVSLLKRRLHFRVVLGLSLLRISCTLTIRLLGVVVRVSRMLPDILLNFINNILIATNSFGVHN